jgi:hypothetical protein
MVRDQPCPQRRVSGQQGVEHRAFVIVAAGTEEGRPPGCESGGRPGEEAAGS